MQTAALVAIDCKGGECFLHLLTHEKIFDLFQLDNLELTRVRRIPVKQFLQLLSLGKDSDDGTAIPLKSESTRQD